MKSIQDWLEHSVLSTIMDIYSHIYPENRKFMAETIEDSLKFFDVDDKV